MWNCVDDKNDNEEGRAPLEYLPRGPRVSSYATDSNTIRHVGNKHFCKASDGKVA